jgi:hypothetical protein
MLYPGCFIIVLGEANEKNNPHPDRPDARRRIRGDLSNAAGPQAPGRIPNECGRYGFLESALREYPKRSNDIWRRQN